MKVSPRFFLLQQKSFIKKKEKISATCRSYVVASTMNVSILALTLFTPECSLLDTSAVGLHTQKFIAEKNQYVTFTSTSFSRRTCYVQSLFLYTAYMFFRMRSRRAKDVSQKFVNSNAIRTTRSQGDAAKYGEKSPPLSSWGIRAPRNIDFSHKTLLTRCCTTLAKHVASRD